MPLTLDTYRLLGRSGLRVSPLALGTATFGTDWGWGAEKDEARRLFDLYVEQGGNFIDTANTYTDGSSERLLGEFTRDRRESLVLATKYTTLRRPGDPNSGARNGRGGGTGPGLIRAVLRCPPRCRVRSAEPAPRRPETPAVRCRARGAGRAPGA